MSEPWSSYPATVLIFPGEPEMTVDLREPVGSDSKDGLAAIGLDQPFAILTSHNPHGIVLEAAENNRRFAELEEELWSSGHEYLVIDACSPDRLHCELSVAARIDRDEALRIAERWEQIAIFWWDLERFWIYGAVSAIEPPIALPIS